MKSLINQWFWTVDNSILLKAFGCERLFISAFRQLSEAKQKTTRYAGGNKKLYKKSPFKYNKGVQAYCKKKGEMYGKPNT